MNARGRMIKSSIKSFTLIELLFAAAILLVAVLALLATYINCIFLNEANNNLVIAANDAQYVLEQIKSTPFNQIEDYAAPVLNNLTNENIAVDSTVESRIANITVSVGWTERQRARSFELSTSISR